MLNVLRFVVYEILMFTILGLASHITKYCLQVRKFSNGEMWHVY